MRLGVLFLIMIAKMSIFDAMDLKYKCYEQSLFSPIALLPFILQDE